MKYKVAFWLKGNRKIVDAAADKAFDNGLTDAEWVSKGGRLFVELEQEADTPDKATNLVKTKLEGFNVPLAGLLNVRVD